MIRVILLFITIILTPAWGKTLKTSVSQTQALVGQVFQLIIDDTSIGQSTPHLQGLENDFTVLGTGRSSSITMVNGSITKKERLIINLASKKAGEIIIPSIKIGQFYTEEKKINIIKSKSSGKQGTPPHLIQITANIKPSSSFVQEQIIYTVQLKVAQSIASHLTNAQLSAPEVENSIIKPLHEDKRYQQTIGTTPYLVIERSYAIFPQQAGQLKIKGGHFSGKLQHIQQNAFGIEFSPAETIRKKVNDLSIDIKPSLSHQHTWLPAKNIILSSYLEKPQEHFEVGVPISQIITIKAVGLTAAQLPTLKVNIHSNATLYTNPPELKDSVINHSITGERQEKISIIPQTPGNLTLPEIHLTWWNTKQKKFETAALPKKTLLIKASKKNTQSNAINKPLHQTTLSSPSYEFNLWKLLFILSLVLLILITLLFFYLYKRTLSSKKTNKKEDDLYNACMKNDKKRIEKNLLICAKEQYGIEFKTLSSLANHLSDDTLIEHILRLEQTLYSLTDTPWNEGKTLWNIWRKSHTHFKERRKKNKLPSLYPE